MANKVGVIESEYESLLTSLSDSHADSLDQLNDALSKLTELNTKDGGLQVEKISPNINKMISEINSIRNNISELYETHQDIVTSFVTAISNYDVCE